MTGSLCLSARMRRRPALPIVSPDPCREVMRQQASFLEECLAFFCRPARGHTSPDSALGMGITTGGSDMAMVTRPGTVSRLLGDVRAGANGAKEQLGRLLAAELNDLAERFMYRERVGHTLQPGDLVQEVFVRLLE